MSIRQILLSKIVRQLWVILIPLTAFPIFILGWMLIETGQQATRTAVLQDYHEIALRASREIELLVLNPQDMLRSMSAIVGVTHTEPWKQETAIIEMQLNARGFEQLVYLDLEGKVLTSGTLNYDIEDSTFAATLDVALRRINAAPDTGFYRSDIYLLASNMPAMTMAAPVDWYGRPVGIMAAQVNLRSMWETVGRIKIGESGALYVVSHEGIVVAHPDIKYALQRDNWGNLTPVGHVLRGQQGSLEYVKPDGRTYLAAYATLPALQGGVIVEQPISEAYAVIDTMRRQSNWIVIFSALTAMVIGVLVARSIVRPVLQLVEGTRQISHGDLTHRIELDRLDEIGQLAQSFNVMAQSLKASYDGLEQQVADRTSQLRHTLEELRRLGELKSKFVSDIAHELRTPLTAVQGFADTLIRLEGTMTDEQRRQCCRTISEECTRVSRMLSDLLDLSKVESGQAALNMAPITIVPVARDAVQAAQPRAAEKNIWIGLYAPDTLPAVLADRDAIRRVFDNLIDNAMKYTPNGGAVTVTVSVENDRVAVSVADTGIGIPEKEIHQIFDRFFRIRTPGVRTPGAGLGLPIVKSIIEEHGGEVSADSTPGEGTTLSFSLPAVSGEDVKYESEEAHSRG